MSERSDKRYYTRADLEPLFTTMSAIDTAVYVADMETYEILAVNEYIEKKWGKDCIGRKCYEVLQQDQVAPCAFCTNDKLLNERGEPNPPYVWLFQNTRTGSYFQCVDMAIPWENGKLVRLEVAINIDKLISAWRERDTQIELIKTIIENIPQAVFWKDRNGVFMGCNKQFAKDAGRNSPEEIIGKTDYDLPWTKQESNGFRAMDREIMETGVGKLNFEESHTRASGEVRSLIVSKVPLRDSEGNIIGVLGTYGDITEIKRAQEILRRNEQLLNGLMQTLPVGVLFVRNRVIEWCNDRLCEMIGYTREELVGQSTRMLYESDAEFQRVGQELYSNLKGENTSWSVVRWLRKNGEGIDVQLNAVLKNPNDPKEGIIVSVLDIREQKRIEEERRRLTEHMHQLQKIQSLETLAGGVAHDFNNILMAIIGCAELAEFEIENPSAVREYLHEIVQSAKRGSDLSLQMLAYAGRRRIKADKFSLNKLVEEMSQILKSAISKKVVLNLELAEDLPLIHGDETQISQVILNLVMNANEAIQNRSGVIVIRTSARICDRRYLDSLFIPGELSEGLYVVLEVTDTGCGMSQEIMDRIFEPFFTTKFTGRGMGLASVLGIVRNHKGGIKVYSEVGKGTTFKVFLPALDWQPMRPSETQEQSQPWKGKGTILLAEDEDTVRSLTTRMLEFLGFKVVVATDGREAVKLFKEWQSEIVAIILDLTMPHKDGIETAQEIRQLNNITPIILMSGYPEEELEKRYDPALLAGYLQKPFRLESIQNLLKKVLK